MINKKQCKRDYFDKVWKDEWKHEVEAERWSMM